MREGGIGLKVRGDGEPISWPAVDPDLYADPPSAGRITLLERDGPGRITIRVEGETVGLTVDDGVAVTTEMARWTEMLRAATP